MTFAVEVGRLRWFRAIMTQVCRDASAFAGACNVTRTSVRSKRQMYSVPGKAYGLALLRTLLRTKVVTLQLEKTLTLTPALSPRRGRIVGSLKAYSPFGEFVGTAARAAFYRLSSVRCRIPDE